MFRSMSAAGREFTQLGAHNQHRPAVNTFLNKICFLLNVQSTRKSATFTRKYINNSGTIYSCEKEE